MQKATIVTKRIGSGASDDAYRPALTIGDWTDVTGQPVVNISIAQDAFTVEVVLSEAALATIEADGNYVVLWSVDTEAENQQPPDLSPEEIEALRAKIENLYYSDIAALVTETAVNPADIASELIAVQLRPPWRADISVIAGQVYQYSGNLYEVIQSHTTQADWTPDIVPALFKRFYEPDDDPWPWVQPQGAHDAYPLNARVLHNGFTWLSLIAANVWEPGSAGAEALWMNLTPPTTAEWQPGMAYTIGDIVTYAGLEYECRQSHTSQVGWEPPNVLALWLPL